MYRVALVAALVFSTSSCGYQRFSEEKILQQGGIRGGLISTKILKTYSTTNHTDRQLFIRYGAEGACYVVFTNKPDSWFDQRYDAESNTFTFGVNGSLKKFTNQD